MPTFRPPLSAPGADAVLRQQRLRQAEAAIAAKHGSLLTLLGDARGAVKPAQGGFFQDFERGSIFCKLGQPLAVPPRPDLVFEVHGAIRDKWAALGWEKSVLGFPTSDETAAPDGVGRFNQFEHGCIYWHPATGVFEVHGEILKKWRTMGGERSVLGYPRSDELVLPDLAGRASHFQGGAIYFHPEIGTFEVHGLILGKWQALGAEQSFLGYPTSDELPDPASAGRLSHFQNGTVYWSARSGLRISSHRPTVLHIRSIRCISASTGVDGQYFEAVNDVLKTVKDPIADGLTATQNKYALIAAKIFKTAATLYGAVPGLLQKIDAIAGDEDQLFISRTRHEPDAEHQKLWPGGDHETLKKGDERHDLDIAVPFTDGVELHFWEADRGFGSSPDDWLGSLRVDLASGAGSQLVLGQVLGNPSEGSLYAVAYTIEFA